MGGPFGPLSKNGEGLGAMEGPFRPLSKNGNGRCANDALMVSLY